MSDVPTMNLRFIERDKLMQPPDELHYIVRQRILQQMFWVNGVTQEWRDVPVVADIKQEDGDELA